MARVLAPLLALAVLFAGALARAQDGTEATGDEEVVAPPPPQEPAPAPPAGEDEATGEDEIVVPPPPPPELAPAQSPPSQPRRGPASSGLTDPDARTQPYYYGPQPRPPPPVSTHTETRQRIIWPLLAPGIGALAGGWVGYWLAYTLGALICVTGSCSSDFTEQWGYSLIPLAGPWLNIGLANAEPIWPTVMGILQSAGLVLMIVGLTVREEVEVEVPDQPRPTMRVELGATPMGGPMLRATVEAF